MTRFDHDNKKVLRAKAKQRIANNPEKKKSYMKKWVAEHKEQLRKYHKDYGHSWRVHNKEKMKGYGEKWRSKNPDKVREMAARWKAANPDAWRIFNQNRRALRTNSEGKLSPGLKEKLFEMQKGKCACCGLSLGNNCHMDHIMPLILGGTNTDDNMQLLRKRCNLQKNSKHPVDFMQSRGFLL